MPSGMQVTLDTRVLDRLIQRQPEKIARFLDWMAESIVTDIKLSFGESPSAPGQPPGVDTGTLWASIGWEPTGANERTIHDGGGYGIYLEDGTEKMAARPFMAPAFSRAQERIERDARQQLGLEEA